MKHRIILITLFSLRFRGGGVKKESGVWKIAGGANLEEWVNLQL